MSRPRTPFPRPARAALVVLALLAALGLPAAAADRWSVAVQLGGANGRDEVRSQAANVLTIVDEQGQVEDRYIDPRPDTAVTNRLKIDPSSMASVSVRYQLTPIVFLEGLAGYQSTSVGDIEVSRVTSGFSAGTRLFEAGDLTRVPLQLGVQALLREGKRVRPYAALGAGYSLYEFDPSERLDQLSIDLESSRGQDTILRTENAGQQIIVPGPSQPTRGIGGAEVDAPNAVEWYLASGFEVGLASRWAFVADLRFHFSNHGLRFGFDGGEDLGVGIPQGTVPAGSEPAEATYGPVSLTTGGIDFNGNGARLTGLYYIRGGRIGYRTVSLTFGVRRTF